MKLKKVFVVFLAALVVFLIGINNCTVYAKEKAVRKPDLKMVTQPATEYKTGSTISFVVTSSNYSGKVEYRVNLYNVTTKKTVELWAKIPGYYNKGIRPAGNSKFTVNWPATGMEPGTYSMKVFVRRAGTSVSYDDYVQTNTFVVKQDKVKLDVKAISKNSSSLVLLKAYDIQGNEYKSGSGVIVSNDGKIVTNYHVIDKATSITAVANDGKEYDVTGVFSYDVDRDIAILNVEDLKGYPYLNLGDSSKIELGEEIVAIGSPMGLQNTVSTGIVSSIRKNLIRNVEDSTDIQVSAPISSGSSGGALLNMYGELVGITYAALMDGQNLNFAIPINEVKDILKNNNKDSIAFDNVMNKVYDQYDLNKVSDFSIYLFQNYSTYKGEEANYEVDMIDVYTTEKGDTIFVDLIVHSPKYESYKKPLNVADISKWVLDIENQVVSEYPDKNIDGTIMMEEYFSEKPAGFSEDDIIESKYQYYADESRKWIVQIPIVSFGINENEIYCGESDKDGKFEGLGYCLWSGGDYYYGNWSGDVINGEGLIVWADGDKYLGEFKDGKMHGVGVYTYADGRILRGEWQSGDYIGQ